MLIDIRDRASSWVAYIIIGLLVLSFALWGIQEYFGAGPGAPIATVNGNEITQVEFNNQFQQYRQRLRSILGADYDRQYADESIIRKQVIDGMVRTEVLRQEVTDSGYRTSDRSLIDNIQRIPQFQTNGKFDPELYERLLQVQRYSKAQFENELREQGKLQQFEISLASSSFMPKSDLQRFQSLSEQSRDFRYALVKPDMSSTVLTDEEVEKYYQENQQRFQTPDQVKLSYVELKEEQIADQIEIADDEARNIYDSQPEHYMTDELRRTRHILLKVSNEVSQDAIEWDEAMDKANSLVQKLSEGAEFAELAKQNSEDSLSAEKGGDIGFIAPGDFTSVELDEALFSLDIGENSQPVRTKQGVQIVYLDEIQESEQMPFESVSEQIKNERKSQLAQARYIEIAEEIANLVVEQPDDLLEVSESFDLPIQETNWLAANSNAEIFAYPKIKNLAFSEDIVTENLNSELIEVSDGHVIAFRLADYQASKQKPLSDVAIEINLTLKVQKAAEQSLAKGEEFLAQMKSGTKLENISTNNNLELVSHGALRRDDNRVPQAIMEHAFRLAHPGGDDPVVGGYAQPDGSYALLELLKVVSGSEDVDASKELQLSQRVNYGRREFNAILQAIQDDAEIQVFEETL